MIEYSWDQRAVMETVGLPVALLYIDKEAFPDMEAKAAEVYGDVPTRFRGQFIFTAVNKKDFGYQLEEYICKGREDKGFLPRLKLLNGIDVNITEMDERNKIHDSI